MAINRAERQYLKKSILEFASVYNSKPACIFISHKSSDLDAAKKVGNYIMDYANIDIYLDCNDGGLQDAVKREDDRKIVECIEEGLKKSTHLLCLVSDKTYTSWWVPYEIGVAKSNSKNIASLKLKNVDDVPSFLKIENVLMGTKSLNEYLESIERVYKLTESVNILSNSAKNHPLDNYLDWQK